MKDPLPVDADGAQVAPARKGGGPRRWWRRRFAVVLVAVAAVAPGALAVARSGPRDGRWAGYVSVDAAGRALLVACRLYSIEHGGALPPDFPSVLLADGDLPESIVPTVSAALVPGGMKRAEFLALTKAGQAELLRRHAAFDYLGAGINDSSPAAARIIIVAGIDYLDNPRDDTQRNVRYAGFAEGHSQWVPRAEWKAVWNASEAAR